MSFKDKIPFWWVVQVYQGKYIMHGPYLTKEGALNRFKNVSGGEVYLPFRSSYKEPLEAKDEFIEYQERRGE